MEEFTKLVQLMETLRSDQGCPWDKKQTTKAFRTFLLEEVYELIDAIEKDNFDGIKEELGDLLFHIVFIAQICREDNRFDIKDVVNDVYNKMYGRHPHVFAEAHDGTPIEQQWEDTKRAEKKGYSPVSGVPAILPALLRAYVISKRAAKVGFDWTNLEDIYQKVNEEIGELREAEKQGNVGDIEEEIGDVLFSVANVSRYHGIDPETALRRTNDKFVRRFTHVEKNTNLEQSTLKEMDALWNAKKKEEKGGR
jgi:tetrapyrrole methylase family protein / MazG family protein